MSSQQTGTECYKSINPRLTLEKKLKLILYHKYLYLMLIPVLIWYIIFCYVPMYGIVISFQDYSMSKGVFGSTFVGLTHFKELWQDEDFWRAFWNTAIIAVYRIIIEFPISIIVALLLNEIRHIKVRKTIQTIVYLPHFLSWVIVASIFMTLLSPESGIINAICTSMGINTPDIISNPNMFRGVLIWSDVWKEAGFSSIIYVAAMASIDAELYEATDIDGASRWQQIWYVTLPGIRNIIVIMFILMLGQVLTWGFDQVYNFYNPMVYDKGDIIDTYIFRTALGDNKFSFAAAASMFKSLICMTLLVVSNSVVKKLGEESIY